MTYHLPGSGRGPKPLPTILRIAERGITVGDFASMDLWTVSADADARETYEEMRRLDFDVAPVTDPRIWRYAEVATLRNATGTVGEAARPIKATDLVAEHLGLLETVEALLEEPQLFVLCRTGVAGLVTRADVQRQAVSMAALGLVLAAEQGLLELVRRHVDGRWQRLLSDDRLERAGSLLQQRQRHNTAIDLPQCLGIEDLMRIVTRDPGLRKGLGYSRDAIKTWAERLRETRDTLAHAGSLLDAEPDPVKAIRLFLDVEEFAERVWRCLDSVPEHSAP